MKSKNKQNKLCHGSDRGKEKGESLWGKNLKQEQCWNTLKESLTQKCVS